MFEAILRLPARKQHGPQTTCSHVCDFSSNTSAHARWYANLNRDFLSPSVNQKRLVLKLSIIQLHEREAEHENEAELMSAPVFRVNGLIS